MARPTKLTPDTLDNITTALNLGGTHEIAANYVGISIDTFYRWKRFGKAIYEKVQAENELELEIKTEIWQANQEGTEPPEPYKPDYKLSPADARYYSFYNAILEAEAQGAVTHLNFLYKAAPHDPQVSQWLLDKRYGYGRESRVEHTGVDGGPIQIEDVSDVSYEERAARIMALLHAAAQRQETAETEDTPDTPAQ